MGKQRNVQCPRPPSPYYVILLLKYVFSIVGAISSLKSEWRTAYLIDRFPMTSLSPFISAAGATTAREREEVESSERWTEHWTTGAWLRVELQGRQQEIMLLFLMWVFSIKSQNQMCVTNFKHQKMNKYMCVQELRSTWKPFRLLRKKSRKK